MFVEPHDPLTTARMSLRTASRTIALVTVIATLLSHCGGADTHPVAPDPGAASVTLSVDTVTLALSDTLQLVATPLSMTGSPLSGRSVSWSSSHPEVATVTPSGIVITFNTGVTVVTVTIDGQTAQCTVTVFEPARELVFSPKFSELDGGDSTQLTAQYKLHGVVQSPTPQLAWSSSAPLDFPIDQAGHLKSDISSGTVTIIASLDTLKAVTTVTVRPVVKPLASFIYQRDADITVAQPYDPVRTVYIDGSVNVRITPSSQPITAWDPSPDGKSIAVMYGWESFNGGAEYGKIGGYVVNLATRAETPLAHIMDMFKWSPDGKRIAFRVMSAWNQGDLYVINADGSGVLQLTHQTGVVSQPVWSPDSRTIAYANLTYATGTSDLWLINADGTGQHQIPAQTTTVGEPAWSPDGSRIAFDGGSDIWTVAPDGTQLTQITNACSGGSCNNSSYSAPAWSPDSRRLTYGTAGGFYIANSDGSSPINVNVTGMHAGPKLWSPDGTQILFTASQPGPDPWSSIFVVDGTGNNIRQVTHGENVESPRWLTVQ